MDDRDLIASLLAGDAEVVDRVRSWIRAAVGPYRASLAAELEDLEQEILLEITVALREDRYQGRSRLRTYIRACTHYKCIDRLRARGRRQWLQLDGLDLADPQPSAQDLLSRAEGITLALRVAAQMPESCRELWRMLEQGMRYGQMSRRLGISEGALRARVLRCRRRALELRSRLTSRGTS